MHVTATDITKAAQCLPYFFAFNFRGIFYVILRSSSSQDKTVLLLLLVVVVVVVVIYTVISIYKCFGAKVSGKRGKYTGVVIYSFMGCNSYHFVSETA